MKQIICPKCEGTGTIISWYGTDKEEEACEICHGKGIIKTGQSFREMKVREKK